MMCLLNVCICMLLKSTVRPNSLRHTDSWTDNVTSMSSSQAKHDRQIKDVLVYCLSLVIARLKCQMFLYSVAQQKHPKYAYIFTQLFTW